MKKVNPLFSMPEDLMLEMRQAAEQYFSQMQRKIEDFLRTGKFESEEKRLEHEGRTKRIQGIKTGYWKLAPRNFSDIGHIVCKNGVVMFEIGKSNYSRKEIKRILKKWNKEQKEFQKIKEKGKEMITLDNGAAGAEEERNAIPASIELPRYKCHKEVRAAKILKVFLLDTHTHLLVLDVNRVKTEIAESKEYGEKHKPYAGGYYVVYEDGYTSFSPAEAFESGYTIKNAPDGTITQFLQERINDAIGSASMCWDEIPKGVFDVAKANQISINLAKSIYEYFNSLIVNRVYDTTHLNNKDVEVLNKWIEV